MSEVKSEAKKNEKRVKLYIPRGSSIGDPNFFVSVNGVNYLLPRGEESLVPEAVAKEYERSVRAEAAEDRNKNRLTSR